MSCMYMTREVSHFEISALKLAFPLNRLFISVTSDTSHSDISDVPATPQSAPSLQHVEPVGSTARQLSTAVFSAVLSGNGGGGGGG